MSKHVEENSEIVKEKTKREGKGERSDEPRKRWEVHDGKTIKLWSLSWLGKDPRLEPLFYQRNKAQLNSTTTADKGCILDFTFAHTISIFFDLMKGTIHIPYLH